jgi:hypothetical protein
MTARPDMRIARCLRAFAADERGSVLPIVGVCLLAILGFAALAVDISYHKAVQSQLRAAADAAALAAASELPNQKRARDAAERYAELNMPKQEHGRVLDSDDIEFGRWDPFRREFVPGGKIVNAVRLTFRRSSRHGNPASTFFLQIFGDTEADIASASVAGIVLLDSSIPGNPADWSRIDPKKVKEMRLAVEQENKDRMWNAQKRTYDPREQMTPEEIENFLMENFGRVVLLE